MVEEFIVSDSYQYASEIKKSFGQYKLSEYAFFVNKIISIITEAPLLAMYFRNISLYYSLKHECELR